MFIRVMLTAIFMGTVSFATGEDATKSTEQAEATACSNGDQVQNIQGVVGSVAKPCTTCGCEGYRAGCNCICHRPKAKPDDANNGQSVIVGPSDESCSCPEVCDDACDCICHYHIEILDPRTIPGVLLPPEEWANR